MQSADRTDMHRLVGCGTTASGAAPLKARTGLIDNVFPRLAATPWKRKTAADKGDLRRGAAVARALRIARDRKTMTIRPLRKAVFPVGGLGTRFLPATKATPKEMLPVVDRPLIQYAVEEAMEAGIEQ